METPKKPTWNASFSLETLVTRYRTQPHNWGPQSSWQVTSHPGIQPNDAPEVTIVRTAQSNTNCFEPTIFVASFLPKKKKKQSSNIKKENGKKKRMQESLQKEWTQWTSWLFTSHKISGIFDCGVFTAPKKPDGLSLSLLGFVGFVVVGPFIFGYMDETEAFLVSSLKAANPLKQYLLQRFDFVLHDTSGLIESAPQWFRISLKTGITFPSSKV